MTCEKHKYRSEVDAIGAIARHIRKAKSAEMRVYWCYDCKAFHTTTKPKRKEHDAQ